MRPILEFIVTIGKTLAESFPGMPAYVVGGTVRDILVGRPTSDIDLAVGGDVRPVAEELAEVLDGTAFPMDPERDVWRVTVKNGSPVQIDISPLKGDITADLAGRDFTVNAMAWELTALTPGRMITPSLCPSPLEGEGGPKGRAGGEGTSPGRRGEKSGVIPEDVIDPYGGRDDIRAGVVRALGRRAFEDDPLRLIRAFRLAGQLGFTIDGETLLLIRELAHSITSVSAERVRDELYVVLESGGAAGVFRAMSDAGLLGAVMPEAGAMDGVPQGEPHAYDLLNHSLKAMEYAEAVISEPDRWFGGRAAEVSEYLGARLDGGLTMGGLVKLCAFLHDVGKPSCLKYDEGRLRFIGHDEAGADINSAIAARLKLSDRAARTLAPVTRGHMRPLHLTHGAPSRRAIYRYVRDMGGDLPASLVVALADAMATRGRPEVMTTDVEGLAAETAEYYYGEYQKAKAEPLVTGRDLIDTFGLEPGPLFRELLEDVEEKRAEGVIPDRADALKYIREKLAG